MRLVGHGYKAAHLDASLAEDRPSTEMSLGTEVTCSTAARKGAMPASTSASIVAMATSRASI